MKFQIVKKKFKNSKRLTQALEMSKKPTPGRQLMMKKLKKGMDCLWFSYALSCQVSLDLI